MMPEPKPASARVPIHTLAILALLAIAASLQLGYQLYLGSDANDVGPFETVLAQAIAGHFESGAGPARLYGPFGGDHPSVLMHAPLYYRAVALLAWPVVQAGFDPLASVLLMGRALSILGTAVLLFATFGWARLGGRSPRAGWFAVLLVTASPLFGNLMVMVRPDALGVGLQSLAGLLLVSIVMNSKTQPEHGLGSSAKLRGGLGLAACLFVLAFAAKQQNVTVALVTGLMLAWAVKVGRISLRSVAIGTGFAAALGVAYFAIENVLTGGRMWRTVFVYPSGPFRAINYAGWRHVLSIFEITARRSTGLLALCTVTAIVVRGRWLAQGVDRLLAAMLGIELLFLIPLCLFNAGAASNYALQGVVFACILAGRGLDLAIDKIQAWGIMPRRVVVSGWIASLLFLTLADARWVAQSEQLRREELAAVDSLLSRTELGDVRPDTRYFVGRQHLNRLFGNAALIHDDWLYGAFETIDEVEPRNVWLAEALREGAIRQVVIPDHGAQVPGLDRPLAQMGYQFAGEFGEFSVWQRAESAMQ